MAMVAAPASIKLDDKVIVTTARHNPLHHSESYQVGERGTVIEAKDNSSVVRVLFEGQYSVVESTLPLLRRPVPSRTVDASVLHLDFYKEPEKLQMRQIELAPGEKAGDKILGILGGAQADRHAKQAAARSKAALLGCFVADAASMPLHLMEVGHDLGTTVDPLFFATPSCPLYKTEDYPGRYALGQLSPYGEQAFATLAIMKKVCPKSLMDGNTYARSFYEWASTYTGRPDDLITDFKDNMASGVSIPDVAEARYRAQSFDFDDRAQSFVGVAPAAYCFPHEQGKTGSPCVFMQNLEVAVRAFQKNELNVAIACFWGRMLKHIVAEKDVKTSFEAVKLEIHGEILISIAQVERDIKDGTSATGILQKLYINTDGTSIAGEVAFNPVEFMATLHIVLTATSWEQGVATNLLAGGDNCSRATILGAVLGAAFGVPSKYADQLDPAIRAEMP